MEAVIIMKKGNKQLVEKILQASNVIAEKSRRGPGNFMIVSSKVAEIIDNLDIRKHRKKKLNKLNEIMKKKDSE